jgi:hypothetical protein
MLAHVGADPWPRTISTKATAGRQILVYNKEEAMRYYKQSEYNDCRISAYNIDNPVFLRSFVVLIDLDRHQFKSDLSFKQQLSRIGQKIHQKLILGPSSSNSANSKRILCPDCKERLYILPQDQDNYMCLECGQKFPVNEVYEQTQQQKYSSAKLGTIDDYNYNNNGISIFQPQNYRRSPRSLVRASHSPLEEELTSKGYTVVDSQWISQE